MNHSRAAWLWLLSVASVPGLAAELKPETLRAWEAYFQDAVSQMKDRSEKGANFLWLDEAPERIERARKGEILVVPARGNGRSEVPHGLIHHWTAATFIPGAAMKNVLSVVQDYPGYKTRYQPTVVDSRLISCENDRRTFSLRLARKVFLSIAAIDVESETRLFRAGDAQAYSVTRSTRVQEIEDYGKPRERLLTPGVGSGYVWCIGSINRFTERDGGVYVEFEGLVLSRELPSASSWLMIPLVNRLSRGAATNILARTRSSVQTAAMKDSASGRD